MPSATMPTTVATGMRRLRIQGTPPICRGSTVIRVNFITTSARCSRHRSITRHDIRHRAGIGEAEAIALPRPTKRAPRSFPALSAAVLLRSPPQGEAMKQPVERRLAAILAADVAGYSRLMGADEEGTLERLKAHRCEFVDPKVK